MENAHHLLALLGLSLAAVSITIKLIFPTLTRISG